MRGNDVTADQVLVNKMPNPIHPQAHPDSIIEPGTGEANIVHPPPQDHPALNVPNNQRPIPDTGWRGQPSVPSSAGGDSEKNFMRKPPYFWKGEPGMFIPKYTSTCWCSKVKFQFHGEPLDTKHCHCTQCQTLHGAPFQWAVIFPKTSVRLVKNDNDSLHFYSTETRTSTHYVPCKVSCDNCRAPLFDEGRNTVLAYPSSFHFPPCGVPLSFQPTAHIFYGQRVMDVIDGIEVLSNPIDDKRAKTLTAQKLVIRLALCIQVFLPLRVFLPKPVHIFSVTHRCISHAHGSINADPISRTQVHRGDVLTFSLFVSPIGRFFATMGCFFPRVHVCNRHAIRFCAFDHAFPVDRIVARRALPPHNIERDVLAGSSMVVDGRDGRMPVNVGNGGRARRGRATT
ncbi:hypothetical protein EWM64_g3354 [Hericium alpestre]|uniref:CENP-V/GFA domain-containing protein n=1 Tax=Hericium alpestre TaxID=135208 RepID=A0A4Z0A360_9AGAM|nr:hypothetical protein EWM64_g3354 [Hericium alpestre]